MIIGIDFDGTCVKHRFPDIGEDIGAVPVLQNLVKNGHKLILITMRCKDSDMGDTLTPALKWFQLNDIPLYAVNDNPTQHSWTSSRKIFCHVYIDDQFLGCPIKTDDEHAYVDWKNAETLLKKIGAL